MEVGSAGGVELAWDDSDCVGVAVDEGSEGSELGSSDGVGLVGLGSLGVGDGSVGDGSIGVGSALGVVLPESVGVGSGLAGSGTAGALGDGVTEAVTTGVALEDVEAPVSEPPAAVTGSAEDASDSRCRVGREPASAPVADGWAGGATAAATRTARELDGDSLPVASASASTWSADRAPSREAVRVATGSRSSEGSARMRATSAADSTRTGASATTPRTVDTAVRPTAAAPAATAAQAANDSQLRGIRPVCPHGTLFPY